MTGKPGGEKLATQWAFGEPSREAQLASVNTSCQLAIKTLRANMKFNAPFITLDTLKQLDELKQEIKSTLHAKAYGQGRGK